MADWPVPWPVKYAAILGLALPILYLSYHYWVRSTCIGKQLNGRRWPFQKRPPWIPAFFRAKPHAGVSPGKDSF